MFCGLGSNSCNGCFRSSCLLGCSHQAGFDRRGLLRGPVCALVGPPSVFQTRPSFLAPRVSGSQPDPTARSPCSEQTAGRPRWDLAPVSESPVHSHRCSQTPPSGGASARSEAFSSLSPSRGRSRPRAAVPRRPDPGLASLRSRRWQVGRRRRAWKQFQLPPAWGAGN